MLNDGYIASARSRLCAILGSLADHVYGGRRLKMMVRRLPGCIVVKANRRAIRRSLKRGQALLLRPIPPAGGGGSHEHYYHFLFDLSFPLHCLFEMGLPGPFFIEDFGPLSPYLAEIFGKSIELCSRQGSRELLQVPLVGMNPRHVLIPKTVYESFQRRVCSQLTVRAGLSSNQILLIERLPPEGYYVSDARMRGGGAARRSIQNHGELREALSSLVREPFKIHNIQLEKMALAKQVEEFLNADVVIGQHGAGLSNAVWMRPGATVIELTDNPGNDHFALISRTLGLNHRIYPVRGSHVTVDMAHLTGWLLEQPDLRRFFRSAPPSQNKGSVIEEATQKGSDTEWAISSQT